MICINDLYKLLFEKYPSSILRFFVRLGTLHKLRAETNIRGEKFCPKLERFQKQDDNKQEQWSDCPATFIANLTFVN